MIMDCSEKAEVNFIPEDGITDSSAEPIIISETMMEDGHPRYEIHDTSTGDLIYLKQGILNLIGNSEILR